MIIAGAAGDDGQGSTCPADSLDDLIDGTVAADGGYQRQPCFGAVPGYFYGMAGSLGKGCLVLPAGLCQYLFALSNTLRARPLPALGLTMILTKDIVITCWYR